MKRLKEDFTDVDYMDLFPDSRLILRRSAGIKKGTKAGYWFADCECGNTDVLVNPHWVKIGRVKSCRCLREELAVGNRPVAMKAKLEKSEKIALTVNNIPNELKEWLDKLGDGDIVRGVRRLLWQLTKKQRELPPKHLMRE